jgi:hypothetical protein
MNHKNVLVKAWQILWGYKALWLFGALVALTSVSGWLLILDNDDEEDSVYRGIQITPIPYQGFEITLPTIITGNIPVDFTEDWIVIPGTEISLPNITRHVNLDMFAVITITRQNGVEFELKGYRNWVQLPTQLRTTLINIFIVLIVVGVTLWIISRVIFYASSTALIRMVDGYAESGNRLNIWRGLRAGFSRPAWRIFLMDLIIDLPITVVFIGLFTLTGLPLFLWLTGSPAISTFGTLGTISLGIMVLLLAILTSILLRLLKHFFRRACALEGLGVIASFQRGYLVVRQHIKDVGLMWLIIAAIYILWPMTVFPVFMLLVGVGLTLGGSIALLVGGLVVLVSSSAWLPWIMAGIMGALTFILTMIIPLVFLDGLRNVYVSAAWTLTYRDLRSETEISPQAANVSPVPESKTLEADASAPA